MIITPSFCKYTMVRIIGNELPPRDRIGNRVKSLEFIMENEFLPSCCETIWIINQIHDSDLKEKIKSILKNEKCYEISFDHKNYRKANSRDDKIVAAININKARNKALDVSNGDFTFVFDGDCFFDQELWEQTISGIENDQLTHLSRKYYGVLGMRIVEKIPDNTFYLKKHEPSLVFRKDADLRFNESVPFSKAEKIELLVRLGYPRGEIEPQGDLCKNVGGLFHISFNDEISEESLQERMKLRSISIDKLLQKLDYVGFL